MWKAETILHLCVLMGVLEKLVTVGTAAVTCGCAQGSCVCVLLLLATVQALGKSFPRDITGLHCCPCGLPPACHIPDEQRSAFSSWNLWFMA